MDALETCYMSVTDTLSPLGRLAFLPYSYVQTTLQTLRYLIMNTLSYCRLYFVYYYNLFYVLQETEHDKDTFQITYQQRKFNNKSRIRNKELPVNDNVRDMFDPPTNINQYFMRMWFRTGYYYDRFVVHSPVNIFNGSRRSYSYNPYPSITTAKYLNSAKKNDGVKSSVNEKEFVPKPYSIVKTLESKPYSPTFQKASTSGCPMFPGLFTNQQVCEQTNSNEKSERLEIEEITKKDKDEIEDIHNDKTVSNSSSRNIFYKIKIKRKATPKTDQYKDHVTYGRYDLVSQAIKNIIPQPSYKPEGTIGPNMIRFTWHCCAHYDSASGTGGSSGGTMRFAQEFNDLGNTGLTTSKSYLDQVQQQFPWITFADLYTLAGVVAIEAIGGPKVEWKPGRSDCPDANKVPPMGRLPIATEDWSHIQEVFYNRLGFNAQETVALIGGGHGIGGCHSRYSGFNGIWTRNPFSWDNDFFKVLLEENWSLGVVPETGIEQYYNDDKSLMMLNTDVELLRYPEFKRWVEIFANDAKYFDEQFALAFAKLLELGVIRDSDGIQRVKI